MKLKSTLWALAFACAAVSCSDELEGGPNMENGGLTGEGVVKVAINLPTEGPGTRAAADGSNANDEFEDAIESEYTVKNAIIALFKATVSDDSYDETTATFVTARSISLTDPETVDDNVQYRYEYTLDAVPKVEDNEQMLALAILNNNGLFSVDGGNLMYKSTTPVTSYSSLAGLDITGETNASKFTTTGFLMLNAPISNITSVASGNTFNPKVTTLAPVRVHEEDPSDMDNISADPIYVERAVAKVEVEVTGVGTTTATDNNDGTVSLPVTNVSGHSIKFTKWALNVTNKSSYILRNVTGYTTWATYYNAQAQSGALNRFFGSVANPYRVYWAVDKNYSTNAKADFNQFNGDNSTNAKWHDMLNTTEATHTTNVDYCFENTMAAKQQIQGFTTGVLLEGEYAINGQTGIDLFTLGSSSLVYDEASMLTYINGVLAAASSENSYEFDSESLTKGITIDTETEFTTYFKKSDGTAMTSADATILMNDQSVAQINYYKGGKTYYWTRPIKHFGDYYTPTYVGNTKVDYYDNANDYNDNDHLGRYGVVRNNWYQINITSVSGPGYPEIPEIPTDPENPDDGGDGYVKAEINILSWAKRTQNVDL